MTRIVLLAALLSLSRASAQNDPAASDPKPAEAPATTEAAVAPPDKRVFGVLPNYRTADPTKPFSPLTSRQKLYIAFKDSTDWPVYPTAALFSGLYQLGKQDPAFGQGMKGYAKRLGAAYGDQVIGNFMTEGIVPGLLHEDPRYFPRLEGSIMSRVVYAATRIFVCRYDSGRNGPNFAELLGNSTAVAISNAYYPDTRRLSDNVSKLVLQLGTDAAANVGKELWPDIKRKLHHHKQTSAAK